MSLSHITHYQEERALCGHSCLCCSLQMVSAVVRGYAGQYNEQVFKAIDFILNEMSKQGIKIIVALVDYWKMTDGVQQVRCCSDAAAMFHVSRMPAINHLLGTHIFCGQEPCNESCEYCSMRPGVREATRIASSPIPTASSST